MFPRSRALNLRRRSKMLFQFEHEIKLSPKSCFVVNECVVLLLPLRPCVRISDEGPEIIIASRFSAVLNTVIIAAVRENVVAVYGTSHLIRVRVSKTLGAAAAAAVASAAAGCVETVFRLVSVLACLLSFFIGFV